MNEGWDSWTAGFNDGENVYRRIAEMRTILDKFSDKHLERDVRVVEGDGERHVEINLGDRWVSLTDDVVTLSCPCCGGEL